MDNIRYTKLPDKLYAVTVPSIAVYSPEELELYGLPMTVVNNETLQRDYNSSYTHACLPLDKIIDIFNMGFSISLRNPNDVVEIYNTLENYLNDIDRTVRTTINTPKFKEDRLQDIDRFLSTMFELNKHKITVSTITLKNGYSLGLDNPLGYNLNNEENQQEVNIVPRYGGKYDGPPTIPVNPMPRTFVPNNETLQDNQNSGGVTTINYIQNNAPEINFDKIKRMSKYRINKKE